MKTQLRKAAHAVFRIQFHIIFVTKYRKNAINQAILSKLEEVFSRVCEKRKCQLLEFNGENDHVHLLVDVHPDNNISQLIGSLKSASSRVVRKEFQDYLKQFYWKKEDPSFWTDAYCVISAGGAPLEIIKEYIQSQTEPKS
ncbi:MULTISPECIES: IS200/IS605 family transposase [Calothrix]|uniref:IS200/IS605 family transposase n=2 Tax=Calothrix TaxID=1186 RepID=A0ABR8AFX1_9CYAN|nr:MULTISPECIES: IS200/IS605 family transposase [Calothrix]MBD2198085.1 IS200/IS605 family transposase [Calothrix parietina FACHB-288]MBD2226492.1 IS200/IS605 family transposase [Calothrix anomala FACHB-343]